MNDLDECALLFQRFYPVPFPSKCNLLGYSKFNKKQIIASVAVEEVVPFHSHIVGIVTHPDYRKQGIATEIVDCLKKQYSILTANVLFSESENMGFWQNCGFQMKEVNMEEKYYIFRWEMKTEEHKSEGLGQTRSDDE